MGYIVYITISINQLDAPVEAIIVDILCDQLQDSITALCCHDTAWWTFHQGKHDCINVCFVICRKGCRLIDSWKAIAYPSNIPFIICGFGFFDSLESMPLRALMIVWKRYCTAVMCWSSLLTNWSIIAGSPNSFNTLKACGGTLGFRTNTNNIHEDHVPNEYSSCSVHWRVVCKTEKTLHFLMNALHSDISLSHQHK